MGVSPDVVVPVDDLAMGVEAALHRDHGCRAVGFPSVLVCARPFERHGAPGEAAVIRKAIENGGYDNMSAVFAAIESTGGIPYTAQAAQQEADNAIAAIESLPASPYKDALYSLAEFSVSRAY